MDTHGPQNSIMMERILLGVFYLSGWHILSSSCVLRQYHYVADPMNWTEAQTYCRETHTDLATVENNEEMDQLINTVSSFGYNSNVWIGLYSQINWTWSDDYRGSGAEYRKWATNEPKYDYTNNYFCVVLAYGRPWWVDNCLTEHAFICNNGTQRDPKFVDVAMNMTWSSAQRYCRENFRDLATVRNDAENQEIQNLVQSKGYTWIGLFRDLNSHWSDGSDFSFGYWDGTYTSIGSTSVLCGVAALQKSGKLSFLNCDARLPFVCYSVPSPAVTRQIVKLRVKRDDPSVDLNDPAVKADILKKLQKELQDKGISGVNLKWREQPDGKVFHKEGETPQKKKSRKKTEL